MTLIDPNADIAKAYEDLLPELRSYLYRLTSAKDTASDLAHDTFTKVLEKKGQFRQESSLKTWIFSIATNLAIDWLRKRKRWKETAQDDAKALAQSEVSYRNAFIEISRSSQKGAFDFKDHIAFCFACISKTLPIEQQVTLMLRDIYDFKVGDIALIMHAPKGTIKHWLFTARQTMTGIFDKRCALINKEGVCYQCSELNGLFNPKQKSLPNIFPASNNREDLYKLRAKLVKSIDPLTSNGADLEDNIMQVLRKAIDDR